MSDRDITRMPISLRGDDGRVPAARHAPKRPDTTSAEYERQREHLIGHGRPFAEIEERIDRIPLSDEEKSALWLYAWSLTKQLSRTAGLITRCRLGCRLCGGALGRSPRSSPSARAGRDLPAGALASPTAPTPWQPEG